MTDTAPVRALLTTSDVCALLKIKPRTLRMWVSGGRFPAPIKLSDSGLSENRWSPGAVDQWLASRSGGAPAS